MTKSSGQILPSLLNADIGSLRSSIESLKLTGASGFHLDIMDGHFVPPISFGDNISSLLNSLGVSEIETHLMVANPERHIDSFIAAGSTRIIFHYEASHHSHRLLSYIKTQKIETGIAINPGTPLAMIEDVIELCDVLLIMTVNPGWGGQSFISSSLRKISDAAEIIKKRRLDTKIEVDGGINEATITLCRNAGASLFVVGSALFKNLDPAGQFNNLSNLLCSEQAN
jgi:ribulose-phosphate 3-epimerase